MTGPHYGLPPDAFAVALASLPGVGPASLRDALDGRTPGDAWTAVCAGEVVRPRPRHRTESDDPAHDQLAMMDTGSGRSRVPAPTWRQAAARIHPEELWREARAREIGVTWLGDERYPARLAEDPEPPPILFWRGDLRCVSRPTVSLVGTRHCTPAGRAVAHEMGRELAEAGVCVVSGLALGIDGAAHRGALAAPGRPGVTAGIAASGVDVPYPRQHGDLWRQVVGRGVVIAETAPGRPAQAWRFPARNRIIAALADIVVVVESFAAGGSLLTVDAALARGIEVRAVPGPVQSEASAGTNRLLVDGAAPVRHAGDVLDALGIEGAPGPPAESRPGSPPGASDRLGPLEQRVLGAVGWAPTFLGRIVERAGCDVGSAIGALAALEEFGLVIAGDSWWARRSER